MRRRWLAGLGLVAAALCRPAAADGFDIAVSASAANAEHVRAYGVIGGWTHPAPLWQGRRWRLALRHELELAVWQVPRARDLLEVGYSPVFVLTPVHGGTGAVFYVEGAIGMALLSHTRVSPRRELSTAYQFSDMLGLGWRWGADGQAALGLRIRHVSNADIKRPNPGMNFAQLVYRRRF